jgi:hypothetical protein
MIVRNAVVVWLAIENTGVDVYARSAMAASRRLLCCVLGPCTGLLGNELRVGPLHAFAASLARSAADDRCASGRDRDQRSHRDRLGRWPWLELRWIEKEVGFAVTLQRQRL